MVFSSLVFLFCFLPLFLVCYFIPKKRKIRNIVLLVFSLLFYGYGEPIYLSLMILSIVVNYFIAIIMDRKDNKKLWLVIACVFNLGLLFLFKYSNFFLGSINNVFNLNIKFLSLSLPIGISFYTFQILTYVVDVYRGCVPVQKSLINLGCYISAFPQLIAGPIVRYSTVNEELEERTENWKDFNIGIKRFILGLAKKAILANEMAYVCDTLFGYSISEIGFIGVLIGGICYTLQIYFDFSGYSDMAIGLGRMLGFHYLENFNFPYMARSVTDFWRRWHISLSSFFRDYVYIPLGGNRVSKGRHIFNLLIVWGLTGLWHGAGWNFILWGLYYGIMLILEKYVFKDFMEKIPKFWSHFITLGIVVIGWIIFYFTDFDKLLRVFKALVGGYGLGNVNVLFHLQIFKVRTIILFVLACVCSMDLVKKFFDKDSIGVDICYMILFIVSIIFILASSYNPFIYFRF